MNIRIMCSMAVFCALTNVAFADESITVDKLDRPSDIFENIKPTQSKAKKIDVLLLNALPASGKSEVRKYLSSLSPEQCKEQFGISQTVQIDDFPYVHIMRRISEEMTRRGQEGSFFLSPAFAFRFPKEWGTLMHLINQDYKDLVEQKEVKVKSAASWLIKRIDVARSKVGIQPIFKGVSKDVRKQVIAALQDDAAKLLKGKDEEIKKAAKLKEKTIVIEFSRGGADSAPLPLPAPYGYKYSLSQLSPEILEKSSLLYIWVTPEESRRKNEARANPNDPGSILNHGVPRSVMYMEYGLDDIDWMLKNSSKPNTVEIKAHGKTYNLPVGRFDNRVDKTTFTHKDKSEWKQDDIQKLTLGLKEAFSPLVS